MTSRTKLPHRYWIKGENGLWSSVERRNAQEEPDEPELEIERVSGEEPDKRQEKVVL